MLSAFFFFILFITLSGTPQLNVMLQNRATFFKQRSANMYTASAYAWSAALVQVPLACVESMVRASGAGQAECQRVTPSVASTAFLHMSAKKVAAYLL